MSTMPWYEGLPLVASHILLVPTLIVVALNFRKDRLAPFQFSILLGVLFVSTSYHSCEAFDFCPLNLNITMWEMLDAIFAVACVIVIFSLYLGNGEEIGTEEQAWGEVLIFSLFGFTIVYMTSAYAPGAPVADMRAYLVIIVAATLVLAVKVLAINNGNTRVYSKLANPVIIAALVLLLLAVICFNINSYRFFFHSLWHVFAFSSLLILARETYRNVPIAQIVKRWARVDSDELKKQLASLNLV